jgi:hypothetical protein
MQCLRFVDEVHLGRQISLAIGSPEQEEARGMYGWASNLSWIICSVTCSFGRFFQAFFDNFNQSPFPKALVLD